MATNANPYVTIIGAGVAGICMGIQLRKAGFHNFVIVEKRDKVGGTWRDNTYPGCACDVPSLFYSYSFETKRDWSRLYPGQEEILEYLEHCAAKYDLEDHVRFNEEVTKAEFDEAANQWRVTLTGGETLVTTVLVSSVGQLNRPTLPDIPGIDDFQGTQFHSARWNHDHDLAGERVAVIGNGCSAAQFVPEIVSSVAKLDLFQRSAHWIIPRNDREFGATELKLFQRLPFLVKLYRYFVWLRYELTLFPLMRRTSRSREKLTEAAIEHIKASISDPELVEKLTPDYPIGCKRIIIDDKYYPALARDNVDVITTPITRITAKGVELADGSEREVDTIIFGTGFATNEFLAPMEIVGRDRVSLNDAWQDGAEAYLGLSVAGFPNFFMTYGPNTNLGHNSIIFMIESQVHYIMKCIEAFNFRDTANLDVRADAQARFNDKLQRTLNDYSIWATDCESWYKNEAGKVVNNWSGTTMEYWFRTRNPDWSVYQET